MSAGSQRGRERPQRSGTAYTSAHRHCSNPIGPVWRLRDAWNEMQTFLFTDIEGSTRLWERHPAAMGPAIARHEQILRDAIGVRGGTVFNTAGDSVCAVFPAQDRAIAAAIDAQRQLQQEPWESYAPGLRISVRMALDAGDATASGENFVGPVLNRLHRLMKAGHGGQILCTAAIATGDLGPDLRLRDLGRHPLRDIAEETRLCQIVAPGLLFAFPPLVTERPSLPRLPLPPVELFGRDRKIEELDALLSDHTVRLVSLLGPGGVGKTSLALTLGQQLINTFADGVHFVDLSALRDGALVVPTIAGTLEIEDPLLSPEDALISQLQHRSMLLILDNCEQVVDAVAAIARRFANETGNVTILTTSRVPLRLRGEHEVRVEPLPIPQPKEDPAVNPAVQLFSEQAHQVNNRFALTATTEPPVIEICRLLDGLPLAIELAAAWVRILDPATLHARLSEGVPLLKSDARDRPERHRTLTSTIDWSYQLLSPEAQWSFARLSVFQGGIPFDGALAMLQDGGRFDFVEALELIDTLAQANLVQAPSQTGGGPRYLMLQTIQEFGLTVLSTHETTAAHRAHAAYFAAMASAAEEHYRGPGAATWLDRLDADIDNLRAAATWLASGDGGDPERSLRMATELWEYFDIRSKHLEARSFLATVIDRTAGAPAGLRARALAQMGNTWLTNYEQAETFYRRSLAAAAEDPGDDWQMAATLGLGSIALMQGRFEEALSIAKKVLDRCRSSDDDAATAQALLVVGHALEFAGRPVESFDPLDESIRICQRIGDASGVAWARRVQALAFLTLGELKRSEQLFRQSILEFESIGERVMVAFCQLDLIRVLLRANGPGIVELMTSAVAEILPVADAFIATSVLDTGADVLLTIGEPALALELLAASEAWRQSTGTILPSIVRDEVEVARERAAGMLDPVSAQHVLARGRTQTLRDAMQILQQKLDAVALAKQERSVAPAIS